MLKILLIEDEFIISKDIKVLLSKNDYAKIDDARNYNEAKELFLNNSYDLIISDINLNDIEDGIEIITEFSNTKKLPVVYLTAYSDFDIVSRAEKTMPYAYILKPYNNNQLKATINLAILNFAKQKKSIQESKENISKLKLLSHRERDIIRLLVLNYSSKEIAESLYISSNTVDTHRRNILKKLNISSTGELVGMLKMNKIAL